MRAYWFSRGFWWIEWYHHWCDLAPPTVDELDLDGNNCFGRGVINVVSPIPTQLKLSVFSRSELVEYM